MLRSKCVRSCRNIFSKDESSGFESTIKINSTPTAMAMKNARKLCEKYHNINLLYVQILPGSNVMEIKYYLYALMFSRMTFGAWLAHYVKKNTHI